MRDANAPKYLALKAILGGEDRRALRREVSDRTAPGNARKQADQIMRAAGDSEAIKT